MLDFMGKLVSVSSLSLILRLLQYSANEQIGTCNKTYHLQVRHGGYVCLFVLRFYGPVNPMGSCRARSVYLTTRLLGRLSPLSG